MEQANILRKMHQCERCLSDNLYRKIINFEANQACVSTNEFDHLTFSSEWLLDGDNNPII